MLPFFFSFFLIIIFMKQLFCLYDLGIYIIKIGVLSIKKC